MKMSVGERAKGLEYLNRAITRSASTFAAIRLSFSKDAGAKGDIVKETRKYLWAGRLDEEEGEN